MFFVYDNFFIEKMCFKNFEMNKTIVFYVELFCDLVL